MNMDRADYLKLVRRVESAVRETWANQFPHISVTRPHTSTHSGWLHEHAKRRSKLTLQGSDGSSSCTCQGSTFLYHAMLVSREMKERIKCATQLSQRMGQAMGLSRYYQRQKWTWQKKKNTSLTIWFGAAVKSEEAVVQTWGDKTWTTNQKL